MLSEMTLGDYLRFQTAIDPDHEFMVYPDRDLRWTYAEFNDRTDRLARGMLSSACARAIIWASGLAISPTGSPSCTPRAKIGVVMVTVNPVYKSNELDYVLKQSDMKALCVIDAYRDVDYLQIIRDLVPESLTQQRGYLDSEEYPFLEEPHLHGARRSTAASTACPSCCCSASTSPRASSLEGEAQAFDNNDVRHDAVHQRAPRASRRASCSRIATSSTTASTSARA